MKIKNTVANIKSNLGRVSDWLRRDWEDRELENIPPTELDIRTCKEKNYNDHIIQDQQFKHSGTVIPSKIKLLKQNGLGNGFFHI
ncbi:hypothetical protein MAR_022876 [Mya arenaria]|uniref:Uncharacterized protein n=1 Tax=Mya arenaria TaxID=6604 RepID=A0ABY7DQV8_MYAAR|nr:hypothetical protein MAR_022876 [Mya arenaria]